MKKAFGEYERIGKSLLGMSSVWLGKDHLLYVRGRGFLLPFREEYKRYRYQDIQAIGIAKTAGMWGIAVMAGLVAVIFLLILISNLSGTAAYDSTFDIIWNQFLPPVFLAIALIVFIRNFILGARCKATLETGQKSEPLGPFTRLTRTQTAISKLEERIREAQQSQQGTAETTKPDGDG